MAINRGKQYELKFRQDWEKTVPDSFIYRLPDQVSGMKYTSANLCDFICFKEPNLFCIECKSVEGNTFPLSNLTQYSRMVSKLGIPGIRLGVVIWFVDHDKVLYVPIRTIRKMHNDKLKSVNIKNISHEDYDYVDVPSSKKRVFLDSDYSVLMNLEEGW